MSNQDSFDPTSGERAREIWLAPTRPHVIPDPTDPRNGLTVPVSDRRGETGPERRDPTASSELDAD